MRRDVLATNPALMAATVLEAPHCIAAELLGANQQPLTSYFSQMQSCARFTIIQPIDSRVQVLMQLTCWQRRNMMRVAESRSRRVSGLLQLLHSTYLQQHRNTPNESHHHKWACEVTLQHLCWLPWEQTGILPVGSSFEHFGRAHRAS